MNVEVVDQVRRGFQRATEAAMEAGQKAASSVEDSIRLYLTVKQAKEQGFTVMILRNPKTGAERQVTLPDTI